MPKRSSDIDVLIQDLADFQKEMEVGELLKASVAEPLPTEERLRQIERVLETFKSLDRFGRDDAGGARGAINSCWTICGAC